MSGFGSAAQEGVESSKGVQHNNTTRGRPPLLLEGLEPKEHLV